MVGVCSLYTSRTVAGFMNFIVLALSYLFIVSFLMTIVVWWVCILLIVLIFFYKVHIPLIWKWKCVQTDKIVGDK